MNNSKPISSTYVSLIRHGHVHNPADVYYGRLPRFRLSEVGQSEATQTGRWLMGQHPDIAKIFSSPLLRARQTADIIQSQLESRPPRSISRKLIEVHSEWDGTPREILRARDWNLYADAEPPYEQPADLVARMQLFLARVVKQHAGQHIAAVTHGDMVVFSLMWALGIPLRPDKRGDVIQRLMPGEEYVGTASVSTLEFANGSHKPIGVQYFNPNNKSIHN